MSDDETVLRENIGTLARLLDEALRVMNEAVQMTAETGPAVSIEFIADYLNNHDAVDEEVDVPDDWLTRWTVAARGTPG